MVMGDDGMAVMMDEHPQGFDAMDDDAGPMMGGQ
jgi:hypothetical protein